MKKLTPDEMMSLCAPLPTKPVEGNTGPFTRTLPRQCPDCAKQFEVRGPDVVQNPIMRFELCPDCIDEEFPNLHKPQDVDVEEEVGIDDLPEPPTAEDYWND